MSDSKSHELDHPGIAFVLGDIGALGVGITLMTSTPNLALFCIGVVLCYGAALITLLRYGRDLLALLQMHSLKLVDTTYVLVSVAFVVEIIVPSIVIHDKLLQPPQSSPETKGSMVEIDPINPEHLKDGTYYLPITIENTGNLEIDGYAIYFAQKRNPKIFEPKEEDDFMKAVERELIKVTSPDISIIERTGSVLSIESALTLRETQYKISEDDMKKILSGDMVVYYGVVMAYSDSVSEKDNKVYYAERCMYYDANLSDYVNCAGHNFYKSTALPH